MLHDTDPLKMRTEHLDLKLDPSYGRETYFKEAGVYVCVCHVVSCLWHLIAMSSQEMFPSLLVVACWVASWAWLFWVKLLAGQFCVRIGSVEHPHDMEHSTNSGECPSYN